MDDWFEKNPDEKKDYEKRIEGYEFKDGVPKSHLFVKLNPNIEPRRRDFISNGIRSFFKNKNAFVEAK